MYLVRSGIFCVIEGIDGSGKTTIINALRNRFLDNGLEVDFGQSLKSFNLLCEPTLAATGRRIREHLKRNDDLSRKEWLELFHVDRSMNVQHNILPALQNSGLVIQDRYFYSTAAYQGDPLISPTAQEIVDSSKKAGFLEPDLLVYLNIDPEISMSRIKMARKEMESFEKRNLLEKIHSNYDSILPADALILDATRPTDELIDRIIQAIRNKLNLINK